MPEGLMTSISSASDSSISKNVPQTISYIGANVKLRFLHLNKLTDAFTKGEGIRLNLEMKIQIKSTWLCVQIDS